MVGVDDLPLPVAHPVVHDERLLAHLPQGHAPAQPGQQDVFVLEGAGAGIRARFAVRLNISIDQAIALRDFQSMVRPIVQNVMTSRGANTVVDAASVFYSAPENDITTLVIQQLDQNPATRVANVARHPVTECLPQQPAAPAQKPVKPGTGPSAKAGAKGTR